MSEILNEETLRKRALAAKAEFPATDEAISRVRASLVTRLFETAQSQSAERERLYQAVQVLDAIRTTLLATIGNGQDAIDEYLKSLAATENA